MRLKFVFAAFLFVAAVAIAPCQTAYSGQEGEVPYAVGAGFSSFSNPDFGDGRIQGGALWLECNPEIPIPLLRGVGVEIEARDLNYGRTSRLPSILRQDTVGGGAIYHWHRFHNFRPYGKFLWGFGSIDFPGAPGYHHDTRSVTSVGGGFDARISRSFWFRGDYEYQWWSHFGNTPSGGGYSLNPQGITIGALYSFRELFRH